MPMKIRGSSGPCSRRVASRSASQPRGHIATVNRAVLDALGYSPAELVGGPVSLVFDDQRFLDKQGAPSMVTR